MIGFYALYHMARADIFERTRRYSFLIMLGLVVWLGYLVATGVFVLRVSPNFTGVINSPWVGALMAVTVNLFLGWFGFYLIKGSVARDYETSVGQIMATTPLTRVQYMLGKWLSNFAVLAIMILILLVVGAVMVIAVGAPLNLWALASPVLIIGLPCMALVAAIAVLFDTIRWLRGGLGNVIYLFAFMLLMLIPAIEIETYYPLLDFTGFRLIGDTIAVAAQETYPEATSSFGYSALRDEVQLERFVFDGLNWSWDILWPRLVLVLIAIGVALVSAIFFDRFNTSTEPRRRRRRWWKKTPPPHEDSVSGPAPAPARQISLTPVATRRPAFRFGTLYIAELKLMLKGQPWWWYGVAGGLVLAQFFNQLETTRILLVVSWAWPVLILSGLGTREGRYQTGQIIFIGPRPVLHQLPAKWLGAFTLIALTGSGALIKFLTIGEIHSGLAWLSGALFIPSLALTLGVLTGSSKAFEVVYVGWMYLISQNVPPLDFVGMTPDSPWYIYVSLGLALVALTGLMRHWQVRTGRVDR